MASGHMNRIAVRPASTAEQRAYARDTQERCKRNRPFLPYVTSRWNGMC